MAPPAEGYTSKHHDVYSDIDPSKFAGSYVGKVVFSEQTYLSRWHESLCISNLLVTGASKGLGLVSAKAYAQSGASVYITARSTALLQKLKEQLERDYSVQVGYSTMDTVNEDSVKASVEDAVRQFGKIDVVIANGKRNKVTLIVQQVTDC
jgi:hypothetical protein